MAVAAVEGVCAKRVICDLANENPEVRHLVCGIGAWLLDQAPRGLRDGRRDSRTYDLSFVGANGSFACITVQSGKWNRVKSGLVRIDARFSGQPDDLEVFRPKAKREAERGWHYVIIDPQSCVDRVLDELQRTVSGF